MSDSHDPVQHVIVLMLENCSFDRALGACQKFKAAIDGVATGTPARRNICEEKVYEQLPGAARVVLDDPQHETPHVLQQLKTDADGTPNSGFVQDYAASFHDLTEEGRGEVMRYFDVDTLPALHALAKHFLVCDHWFSSVPGPTWANRLFAMSGTSLGRVGMPAGVMDLNLHWYDQTTLFDRLDERSVDWRIYFGDTPLSLLLVHQWEPKNLGRHKPMTQFFQDVAGDPGKFPGYVFIEPAYLDPGANDGHPPHDVLASEALVADVYNAIRANQPLWQSSLLVVLCDEHGGFYDHVPPPATIPPDHHQDEYAFDRLGARVPALLVSPWVENAVCPIEFDHTSLLRYLTDKWGLGSLGARTEQANTFKDCFLSAARTDTPQNIPAVPVAPISRVPAPPKRSLTGHENAIVALSHALESMAGEDATTIAARSRQILSGPQSQIDAAVDRVTALLKSGSVELLRNLT
jgi:phospholipase C